MRCKISAVQIENFHHSSLLIKVILNHLTTQFTNKQLLLLNLSHNMINEFQLQNLPSRKIRGGLWHDLPPWLGAPSVLHFKYMAMERKHVAPSPKDGIARARRADKFLFAARERERERLFCGARASLPCVLFVLIEFPVVSLVSFSLPGPR